MAVQAQWWCLFLPRRVRWSETRVLNTRQVGPHAFPAKRGRHALWHTACQLPATEPAARPCSCPCLAISTLIPGDVQHPQWGAEVVDRHERAAVFVRPLAGTDHVRQHVRRHLPAVAAAAPLVRVFIRSPCLAQFGLAGLSHVSHDNMRVDVFPQPPPPPP